MNLTEMHCHTNFSNTKTRFECLDSVEKILSKAKAEGLKAIAITDHNTMSGSKYAKNIAKNYRLTIIPAEEFSTTEGHILGYGIRQEIKPFRSASEIIKDIKKQGGVSILAHPFHLFNPIKNIEKLINIADGIEIYNASQIISTKNCANYITKYSNSIVMGGSDSHNSMLIGSIVLEFPNSCKISDEYLECLRLKKFRIIKRRGWIHSSILSGFNILCERIYNSPIKKLFC